MKKKYLLPAAISGIASILCVIAPLFVSFFIQLEEVTKKLLTWCSWTTSPILASMTLVLLITAFRQWRKEKREELMIHSARQ